MSNQTQYKSLQDLVTLTSLQNVNRVVVVLDPGNDGSQGTTASLGVAELSDVQSHVLADVLPRLDVLEAKPGNGAFASPVTMSLTGLVTGSANFDGSSDFALTTTMADGALSISKVNSLASTLSSLQSDVDSKLDSTAQAASAAEADKWTTPRTLTLSGSATGSVTFDGSSDISLDMTIVGAPVDPTLDIILDNGTAQSPAFGWNDAVGDLSAKMALTDGVLTLSGVTSDGGAEASLVTYTMATKMWSIADKLTVEGTAGFNSTVGFGDVATFNSMAYFNAPSANTLARFGNAVELYDVSYTNAVAVKGVADPTSGYFTFGKDATKFGYSASAGTLVYGANAIYHAGNFDPTNPVPTGGILQVGDSSGDYMRLKNDGTFSLNGGVYTAIASANTALSLSTYISDINAVPSSVFSYWNPSTANIGGLDQYGVMLELDSVGGGGSSYRNQLALGTNGALVWRTNINSGGWNNKTVWHSGNLTPSNYISKNSTGNRVGDLLIGSTAAAPYLYESDTTNHSFSVRTGASGSYKSFTFGYDGNLFINNGGLSTTGAVVAGGEVQSTVPNSFRSIYGDYGVFWRNDGANFYLMKTASGDASGGHDSTRPLSMALTDGNLTFGTHVAMTGGLTVSGAISLSGTGGIHCNDLHVDAGSEGHVYLGNGNDYYLFANDNNAGLYSAANGYAYGWNYASRTFTVYGTSNTQSDERVKTRFEDMEPRPLWRHIEMESWDLLVNGQRGYGTRAQKVVKFAPEYVKENTDVPVAEVLGRSRAEVRRAKKRIANGLEQGVLAVDNTTMALEMAMAAGKLVDKLEQRIAELEKLCKPKA